MQLFNSKPNIVKLQWMLWVFIFFVLMLSLMPMDGFVQASVYALLNTLFYSAVIYGNILWLYPTFYQKDRIILYILSVILFLVVIGVFRAWLSLNVYNFLFAKHQEALSFKVVFSMVTGGLMIFLLSFVFRIVLAYFTLKQQSEEIIAQKTQAELNLLKSQVQPHFLFNTLNNIYYEAYLEAPHTAGLIERLSDIMRYFVDESPKQLVTINTEIQFIENYISLEKIRIRYDIDLSFMKDCEHMISIPPMLLMTFVENIFKHGIDKTSTKNKIIISLIQEGGRLIFRTENTKPVSSPNGFSTGFGIENLRKRLVLLYEKDFELQIENKGDIYCASLNIPIR